LGGFRFASASPAQSDIETHWFEAVWPVTSLRLWRSGASSPSVHPHPREAKTPPREEIVHRREAKAAGVEAKNHPLEDGVHRHEAKAAGVEAKPHPLEDGVHGQEAKIDGQEAKIHPHEDDTEDREDVVQPHARKIRPPHVST